MDPKRILPDDYEVCAECGYDHEYEYEWAFVHHSAQHEAEEDEG